MKKVSRAHFLERFMYEDQQERKIGSVLIDKVTGHRYVGDKRPRKSDANKKDAKKNDAAD